MSVVFFLSAFLSSESAEVHELRVVKREKSWIHPYTPDTLTPPILILS